MCALYMLVHFYEYAALFCFSFFFFLVDMLCVGLLLSFALGGVVVFLGGT